jgi:hypothetical protein
MGQIYATYLHKFVLSRPAAAVGCVSIYSVIFAGLGLIDSVSCYCDQLQVSRAWYKRNPAAPKRSRIHVRLHRANRHTR